MCVYNIYVSVPSGGAPHNIYIVEGAPIHCHLVLWSRDADARGCFKAAVGWLKSIMDLTTKRIYSVITHKN